MVRPKLAFVGSGGATKGIAHLGVLKALEEFGIRPDIHVGTSSGALAAAFFAQGVGSEEMMDWLRPRWRRSTGRGIKGRAFLGLPRAEELTSLGRLTSGVLSIDRFEKHLESQLPMNDFRQLDTTLLITATDIDGQGRTVFGRGHREDVSISQAVAASCCVPLLFRPYRIGDRYYLDGELVRTLSIDLAVNAGADIVVVSNVYRPNVSEGPSIANAGPMAIARQALNVLLSEKEARGIELLAERYPHVTILNVSPDLGAFSFTSRRNARKLLLRGYREGLRVLVDAKRRGLLDGEQARPSLGLS